MASSYLLRRVNLACADAGAVGAYFGGPIADIRCFMELMAIYGGVMLLSISVLAGVKLKAFMR